MKVAIIGGGPAGCAAAYTLQKNNIDFELFEAADEVGGRTKQLHRNDGYNLGTGALFHMGGIYPRTMALLREMGRKKQERHTSFLIRVIANDELMSVRVWRSTLGLRPKC